MLTFTHTDGQSLRVTGGGKPVHSYPSKPAEGDINLLSAPKEDIQVSGDVSWPGEYDIAGVTIRGIGHSEGKQVSFVIQADDYRVAFPSLPLQEWSDGEIESLGDVHVLVIPATDAKIVQKLVDEIDPRVLMIVPDDKGGMDSDVLKAVGAIGKEQVGEFKLKSLPAEGREVVVFA